MTAIRELPPARPDIGGLAELVDEVLARVDWQPGWAVGLEGSLAEGFGNATSDIDLLLLDPGDADPPTMPAVLFAGGRRIEVRVRSARQLRQQFGVLSPRCRPAALTEHQLDRCQRVLGAIWLRNEEVAEALLPALVAGLPAGFDRLVAGWWAHYARQSLRQAAGSALLGQVADAVEWARVGLVQAAKSWAARRGETYLEPKWLALQLARLDEPTIAESFRALHRDARRATDAQDYVAACREFARGLGVSALDRDTDQLTVDRMPGVTTWPVRDRLHVVRGRRDVFALGDAAGRVWRSVTFGQSLTRVLAAAHTASLTDGVDAGALLADFLRYGLLRLRAGGAPVAPRTPYAAPAGPMSPPPSAVTPLIGLGGARVGGPGAVDLLPLPVDRFSAAAMNLVWSNIVLENLAEDLAGAVTDRQWPAAELAIHRGVLVGLRAVLSAYGVAPLPPDPELARRVATMPDLAAEVSAAALRATAQPIHDARSAAVAGERLAALVRLVRRLCGADEFPASFTGPQQWNDTLSIGYEWLRLGSHLGVPLPIEDAGDLMSGSVQPHVRIGERGGD